ncbi:hypothetical protein KKG48_01555 [Patescibacteria group bacterium]|nr:hypothetical protein [Patescibacteria group bacterium]
MSKQTDSNEMQKLFKRSRLFPLEGNSFQDVILRVCPMDFPFRSWTIFHRKDDEKENFSNHILPIIKDYIRVWIDENPSTEKKYIDRIWSGISDLYEKFNPGEIFNKISSGHDWVDIPIGINNSVLRTKRFGNCIGFKVLQGDGIHKTGFEAMTFMCDDRNCSISPFIHRIECSIPILSKQHGENNSVDVYFHDIYQQLVDACRSIEWKTFQEWFPALIEQYQSVDWNTGTIDQGIVVGYQEGVEIQALIVHSDEKEYQQKRQWRKGNVTVTSKGSCNFSYGDDLRLLLMAHSGLHGHNFFSDFDTTIDIAQSQYCLNGVGAILYVQLCCMLKSKEFKNTHAFG